MALLGIDFGTASVRVVVVAPGSEPRTNDVVTSPALVAFGDDATRAGEPVLLTLGALPEVVTISGIKRLLGRALDDPLVARAAERCGFVARVHGNDLALRASEEGREMKIADGASELLRYVVELVAGRGAHEAVITVPSWFEASQRDALFQAARSAHLKVLRFVRDTMASALWLATAHGERGRAVIVDAGAGGVSVSLATLRDGEVRLDFSRGSAAQGGDDIDDELAAQAPGRPDRLERAQLFVACEALKRSLGSEDRVEREVTLKGERKVKLTLERWQLELLAAPVSAALDGMCRSLLAEAGWRPDEIDLVIATGGMSELVPIAQAIEKIFGKKPERAPEGLHAAVLGAALQAANAQASTGAKTLSLIDGERPPQLDEPAAPPSKGSLIHGPVVKRRKPPERYRPPVTISRRRRSIPPTPMDEITADMPPSEEPPPSRPHPSSPTPPSSGKPALLPGLPAPSSAPPAESARPRRESPVSVAIVPRDDVAMPRGGTFVLPSSAAQMMALAITRPLLASDLEPIALPVLFRRLLARRSVMGTVIFEAPGFELAFDVESGSAALTRSEHVTAQRLWDLRQGKWRLSDERQPTKRRDLYPLNRLALDGLKRMMRSLEAADLEKAFGELLELSPQIRSDRQTLPKRLGLGGRELRFIDQILNGKLSGRAAMAEGTLGPTNTLQLYALLELHDALMWTEIGAREPSPRSLRGRRTLMGMGATSRPLRATLPFEKSPGDGDDSGT